MITDWLRRAEQSHHGRTVDTALYVLSAGFALLTALTTTLPAHVPWGWIALPGYLAAAGLAFFLRRGQLAVATWGAVALLPLLVEAVQRAGGNPHRAQEEVLVVEEAGRRMLETGTPFLGRDAIAALPDQLLGYTPYQPGMAVFGLPRAVFGAHWFTDARIGFALVTAVALVLAVRSFTPYSVRAIQAVTVLPVAALTLATGGDDLPVLALTLLGLAYLARSRHLAGGVAIGLAAALKLFAWPVAAVVLVLFLVLRQWRPAAVMVALAVLTAVPALLLDHDAFVENVLRFPLGHGLVTSPAASPLPGHLIAASLPGGRYLALGLLGLAALALGYWLLRRPPRTAAAVAGVCAVGLLAAMLLMPATRFGYLLYPAAYALWIPFLTETARPRTA